MQLDRKFARCPAAVECPDEVHHLVSIDNMIVFYAQLYQLVIIVQSCDKTLCQQFHGIPCKNNNIIIAQSYFKPHVPTQQTLKILEKRGLVCLQMKMYHEMQYITVYTGVVINPLARRPGLVISTFGLAEIISCMPDGLVKIYIGY